MADTAQSFPKGKYMTTLKVGPKGQIVIPKEARDIYGVRPGDSVLLLADREMGIALLRPERCRELFEQVFPTVLSEN